MVQAKKVEKKIAALLIDDSTTEHLAWNEYQKKRGKLSTFQRREPQLYQNYINRIVNLLEEIDRDLYSDMQEILSHKKKRQLF